MNEQQPGLFTDLCDWMPVKQYRYKPLVRKSLDLSCDLKILFLRQDDPGALITQGGDLDGRMKTLLDALRIPSAQEQDKAPPTQNDLYCLMESDTLVSALNIDTERLLLPKAHTPTKFSSSSRFRCAFFRFRKRIIVCFEASI